MKPVSSPSPSQAGRADLSIEKRTCEDIISLSCSHGAPSTEVDRLRTPLQAFQYFDKYARFDADTGCCERWVDAVDRVVDYLRELAGRAFSSETYSRIRMGILEMNIMPSMRLLAMGSDAARRSSVAIYNCSYLPVDRIDSFVESLLITLDGCGVGYSVERRYVNRLPTVEKQRGERPRLVSVEDSTAGIGDALRIGLHGWFKGEDVEFDLSGLRRHGSPLQVKGGTACGPEPIRSMLRFVRARVLARQGSALRPLDAHDIMCTIGSVAISGGVRPGVALLSLFDFDDDEMRRCKMGDFEDDNNQRWNANTSAVLSEAVSKSQFDRHFYEMDSAARGEPGLFNRRAVVEGRPRRRLSAEFGTNPCAEIVLRPRQFCNLSSVIARPHDTAGALVEKIELATIIATIQSLGTRFPGLSEEWKKNCEDERLVGVDLSGQMDCRSARNPAVQKTLAAAAVEANRRASGRLGIMQAAAVTCVKPGGNSSQLVDCSSGLHSRWSRFYVRNVRVASASSMATLLRQAGVPMHPETGQDQKDATKWVAQFPMQAPIGAVTRYDRTAVEQCEYWLQVKTCFTEHSASCTVTYRPDELGVLISWVWEHRDEITGLSFLPCADADYAAMPYVEISEEEYLIRSRTFPLIDFSALFACGT